MLNNRWIIWVAAIAGWIDQRQLKELEFKDEEIKILKGIILRDHKRILLSNDQQKKPCSTIDLHRHDRNHASGATLLKTNSKMIKCLRQKPRIFACPNWLFDDHRASRGMSCKNWWVAIVLLFKAVGNCPRNGFCVLLLNQNNCASPKSATGHSCTKNSVAWNRKINDCVKFIAADFKVVTERSV